MLKSKSLCEQIARTCGWTQVDGQIYKPLEHVPADGDFSQSLCMPTTGKRHISWRAAIPLLKMDLPLSVNTASTSSLQLSG